jgi:3-methylornithine--L-lysine ligase
MRVAIVGGKLQGVEAAYLAQKAGWETLLLDKKTDVPAIGLCDLAVTCDVTSTDHAAQVLKDVDLIIPALEDQDALDALGHIAATKNLPFAFDARSYALTSSKLQSNRLFAELKLPIPATWPACEFPMIVKPDEDSGSNGVQIFHSPSEMEAFSQARGETNGWVAQEFVSGPTFSLEIIGSPGNYRMPQVTDLFMDRDYDCKGVRTPSVLAPEHVDHLERITHQIAEKLQLKGIMDIEVVLGRQGLKLLEIDARLPSQTPTAVYWSTGINMLEMLKDVFLETGSMQATEPETPKAVLYEHIRVNSNVLEVAGEHTMGTAGTLKLQTDFFGADEALTDYQPGCDSWVATMIYSANDPRDVTNKRTRTLETIRNKFGCDHFIDSEPGEATA